MHAVAFHFDPASPGVRALFDRLPHWLQGRHVDVRYEPLSLSAPSSEVDTVLTPAWSCHPAGMTPSRWVCLQLLEADLSRGPEALLNRLEDLFAALRAGVPRQPEAQARAAWQAAANRLRAQGVDQLPALALDGRIVAAGPDACAALLTSEWPPAR